jgi:ATP-dependent DNA ligase
LERPVSAARGGRARIKKTSFAIDGEAVVLGPNGISDFAALQSRAEIPK